VQGPARLSESFIPSGRRERDFEDEDSLPDASKSWRLDGNTVAVFDNDGTL
jgi:hypothetical protein